MKTFKPFEWLLIAAANAYGKDKSDYDVRLLWAYEHLAELEDMIETADDKAMFTASIIAIRDTQERMPTGFLIGLDSSASGIQMLSTASRCVTGMKNTGVVNDKGRPDIYTKLTDWMKSAVKRALAKNAFMTFMYGSEAEPVKAFGTGSVLRKFHATAKKLAPYAYRLRTLLVDSWQSGALSHDWPMPDLHHVHKRVWQTKDTKIAIPMLDNRTFTFRNKINLGTEKGVSIAADVTHSIDGFVVREMQARCNYDREFLLEKRALIDGTYHGEPNRTKYAAIGILDVLTDDELLALDDNMKHQLVDGIDYVLERKSFELVTVHDEFKCLANNVQHMREHYNRILWELYHSHLLFNIIEHITGKKWQMPAFDKAVADAILENDYAIN